MILVPSTSRKPARAALPVSPEVAVRDEVDIVSHREAVEYLDKRLLVGDTDDGDRMRTRIEEIKLLIEAYQSGMISEKK